jgi:hypothetical protein
MRFAFLHSFSCDSSMTAEMPRSKICASVNCPVCVVVGCYERHGHCSRSACKVEVSMLVSLSFQPSRGTII